MSSEPQNVAYPGAEGSYTEEAANRLYPNARQISFATFDMVAAALVAGEVDRGVLPIENSLAGLVPDTLAILEESTASIVAEVALHIPHCLVGPAGATLETVRVVHSHPMALAQCRIVLSDYERVGLSDRRAGECSHIKCNDEHRPSQATRRSSQQTPFTFTHER